MPADLILDDRTIELADARIVKISDGNDESLVRLTGRIRATGSVDASQIAAGEVMIGTSANDEPRGPGRLVLKGSAGQDLFEVERRGSGGRLRVRGEEGTVTLEKGTVRSPSFEGAKVTVGFGAPGEPREAGIIRMLNDGGSDTLELDAGGVDIEKPAIRVRWKQFRLREIPDFRIGNPRLGGSGFRFRGGGGVLTDIEEEEEQEVTTFDEVELDLVEEVLFLRQAVRDLTDRVQALENGG